MVVKTNLCKENLKMNNPTNEDLIKLKSHFSPPKPERLHWVDFNTSEAEILQIDKGYDEPLEAL